MCDLHVEVKFSDTMKCCENYLVFKRSDPRRVRADLPCLPEVLLKVRPRVCAEAVRGLGARLCDVGP